MQEIEKDMKRISSNFFQLLNSNSELVHFSVNHDKKSSLNVPSNSVASRLLSYWFEAKTSADTAEKCDLNVQGFSQNFATNFPNESPQKCLQTLSSQRLRLEGSDSIRECLFDPPWQCRISQLQNTVQVLRQFSKQFVQNR